MGWLKPNTIFAFAGFFILFYVEPIVVGPISIAILWKSALLFVFCVFLFLRSGGIYISSLSMWGLLFSIESLLNPSLFVDPLSTFSFAIKNAYLPLLYWFFLVYFKNNTGGSRHAFALLTHFSVFIVISCLPFLFGVVTPLSHGYDLSIFGIDGAGFVGIFQHSHAASITLGTATLVLVYHFGNIRLNMQRAIVALLIGVGVWAMIMTLARTGFALFCVGVLILLFATRNTNIRVVGLILLAGLVLAGIILYLNSELFRLRAVGLNVYTASTSSVEDQFGSGRTKFWVAAAGYFFQSTAYEQFLGFGPSIAFGKMYDSVGLRIYAHNGFVDVLQFNGYLGVFLYLGMLRYILIGSLRGGKSNQFSPLVIAMLFSYITQMFVQGERIFLADLLFALALVVAKLNDYQVMSKLRQC